MRRFALLALTLLALAGCGGSGDEEPRTATVDDLEITAESSEDLQTGTDLARYVRRNCRAWERAGYLTFRESLLGPDPEARAARRFYQARYGSLFAAHSASLKRCVTYEGIDVADGVITVRTSLDDVGSDRIAAQDSCAQIRGADVADATPGHTVVDALGKVLWRCGPRDDSA